MSETLALERLLPPDVSLRAAWVEVTKTTRQHGGTGWAFGTCPLSPTHDQAGRHRYRIMEDPQPHDLVLHLLEDDS